MVEWQDGDGDGGVQGLCRMEVRGRPRRQPVQWHALLVAQLEGDDVGVGGHVSVGDALGTPGGGGVPQQVSTRST